MPDTALETAILAQLRQHPTAPGPSAAELWAGLPHIDAATLDAALAALVGRGQVVRQEHGGTAHYRVHPDAGQAWAG